VVKPELGMKRQCQNCGAKFYDLGKDPIICPKCGTTFQAAVVRSRAPVAAAKDDPDADLDPTTPDAELVPLEEADASDESKVTSEDVEIDEDIGGGDDETFLETDEEDGDDDVADLIDGDLDDDEEA